ncbi:MAG: hypothetical protein V8R23_05105 [Alphaproteobacteria bacterium]
MRTNFLNKVAAMSGKNVNELVGMSQSEVVNKVILPIIVQPTGQDIRGWRIGDDYMSLMAEFGEYCWQQDAFTGEILLEIALQRIFLRCSSSRSQQLQNSARSISEIFRNV